MTVPKPVERLMIGLGTGSELVDIGLEMVALSPDGAQLAYVASDSSGGRQLYLRPMDTLEARPLSGTEGAYSPFFSPDAQWVGFFAGGSLKKVSVTGGAVLTLAQVGNARGGTWGLDDTIVFTPVPSESLWQVSAAGGESQRFTTRQQGETSHRWPQLLPEGKTVLFTVGSGGSPDDRQIAVQPRDAIEHEILIRGGTYGRYVPTGHLVYYRAGTTMAVSFDPLTLEVRGTAAPMLEGVMSSVGTSGAGQFSFSDQGTLVYIRGDRQSSDLTLVWVDRQGNAQSLPAPPRAYRSPRVSTDGEQVPVGIGNDKWIYSVARPNLIKFTFDGSSAVTAGAWTPDGKRLVFPSTRGGGAANLYWRPADGSGSVERLTTSQNIQRAGFFTPDGQTLVYTEVAPETGSDLWLLPMDGDRKPVVFLQTPFNESSGQVSPDGKWIAYVSDESGLMEVYVRPFPDPGRKWQISTGGGMEFIWSPKGNELFYRTGNRKEKMMVVDYQTEPTFTPSSPRLLFEGSYVVGGVGAQYSISPDGQQFLMMEPVESQAYAPKQINIVLNWFEELRSLAPTD